MGMSQPWRAQGQEQLKEGREFPAMQRSEQVALGELRGLLDVAFGTWKMPCLTQSGLLQRLKHQNPSKRDVQGPEPHSPGELCWHPGLLWRGQGCMQVGGIEAEQGQGKVPMGWDRAGCSSLLSQEAPSQLLGIHRVLCVLGTD